MEISLKIVNNDSNSFLLIGSELDINKVTIKMIKNYNIVAIGDYLNNGLDFFKIDTDEKLAFIKSYIKYYNDREYFKIYKYYHIGDINNGVIDTKKIPRNVSISYYSGFMDDYPSNSLLDLKNRYDPYDKLEKLMQPYLRYKKIQNLKNKNNIQ